MEASSDAVA